MRLRYSLKTLFAVCTLIAIVTALSARRIHEWDDLWLRHHWKCTYLEVDGRIANAYGAEVVYDGTTLRLAIDGNSQDYRLVHNAMCSPRTFVLSTVRGERDSMRGIYKFRNGKLYVFFHDENDEARAYETWPGSGRQLCIFERK